jgi:CheY-like chemotaxis protein
MQTTLIVDDSPIDILMTKTLLEQLGIPALTATNGEEALNMILANSPQFVICDINMPGMSGIELLKATRHFEQRPIFIMATGLGEVENAVTSLQYGAYDYLIKPLKEYSLREALRKATFRRQRESDTSQKHEALTKTDALKGPHDKGHLSGHAATLRKEHTTASDNLQYSPIRLLYTDTPDGPVLDLENPQVTLTLLLEHRLPARPQTGVEVHFLPRGMSRDNHVGEPKQGRYQLFYDISDLYRIIGLITSRLTVFYCDAEDVRVSGFTQQS